MGLPWQYNNVLDRHGPSQYSTNPAIRRFRTILGGFRKKKRGRFFVFFAKIARNRPKSPKIAYFFLTDSKRRDFEDSKTPGLFEK